MYVSGLCNSAISTTKNRCKSWWSLMGKKMAMFDFFPLSFQKKITYSKCLSRICPNRTNITDISLPASPFLSSNLFCSKWLLGRRSPPLPPPPPPPPPFSDGICLISGHLNGWDGWKRKRRRGGGGGGAGGGGGGGGIERRFCCVQTTTKVMPYWSWPAKFSVPGSHQTR